MATSEFRSEDYLRSLQRLRLFLEDLETSDNVAVLKSSIKTAIKVIDGMPDLDVEVRMRAFEFARVFIGSLTSVDDGIKVAAKIEVYLRKGIVKL